MVAVVASPKFHNQEVGTFILASVKETDMLVMTCEKPVAGVVHGGDTVTEWQTVLLPQLFVKVRQILYVPPAAYTCTGF